MGVMRVLQSPLRRTSDARAAAACAQNNARIKTGFKAAHLDDEITESGRPRGREEHYTN